MNLAHLLLRSARRAGECPALMRGDTVLASYAQWARRAAALGDHFRERLGLQPGDRIGLFMSNHPAMLELWFGAWWAGCAVVPINPKLHPREARYILGHCGAALAFATPDLAPGLLAPDEPLPALRALIEIGSAEHAAMLDAESTGSTVLPEPLALPDDALAWLFYTSGTTGRPKGVMLSHRNLRSMVLAYFADVDAPGPGAAVLYAAPMSHGAGLYGLPLVAVAGRHVVPESGGFEPAEILALAHRLGRVSMFAAPTMVKRLVDEAEARGEDGSGLDTIVYGGGPMYREDIRRALAVLGPRFVQIYGQGESPMTITALQRSVIADADHPRYLERLGSVGTAQTVVQVRVADAQGRPLPAGETGEVLVRGDTVMAGYWHDAEASARALREGWLWTGDVGSLDEHGFLTLRDRSKDLIISGGSNIYPREVEEVLLLHPGVAECSVVGQPDAEWGEVVVAFVVARPGHAPDDAALDALCRAHIARFKRPKVYHWLSALPKNHYGKLLKTTLRERLARGTPAGPDPPSP